MRKLIQLKMPPEDKIYSTRYGRFRGVDFGTDPFMVDVTRSPSAVNVVSDAGGYPEKRPGWTVIHTLDKPVHGLYSFVNSTGTTVYVAHCNDKFYTWSPELPSVPTNLGVTANKAKSCGFEYGNKLYILDGAKYWVYDGTTIAEVVGYVPTTSIANPPAGGGVPYEAVNFLSSQRKNSFRGDSGTAEVCRLQISVTALADGNVIVTLDGVAVATAILKTDTTAEIAAKIAATSYAGWTAEALGDTVTFTCNSVGERSDALYDPGTTGAIGNMITLVQGKDQPMVYQLDTTNITSVDAVVVDGVEKTALTHYTVDTTNGRVTFTPGNGPTTPPGDGDNVLITFTKAVTEYQGATYTHADVIKKCTIATWFGMGNALRLFFSGNPDFPNQDWQSATYDPTYFPDNQYTKVGAVTSSIMGYLRQYDAQLIIKSDNEQDATIYMRTAEMDEEGTIKFTLKQGVAGIGAIAKGAFGTLKDDPLLLAKEGVYAPTLAYGGVGQQRTMEVRSRRVNAQLCAETNLSAAVATVWRDLYLLCVNGRCYVADGKQPRVQNQGYEWFLWTNIPAVCFLTVGDVCYFGTSEGEICKFTPGIYNDNGVAIDAWWATKLDDDGDFMRYKTLPLRGNGVLCKPYSHSTIDVYVRDEKSAESLANSMELDVFDISALYIDRLILDTSGISDILSINYPVVNYKALQLIARNNKVNEGFGIYGFIKRYKVGGFVE